MSTPAMVSPPPATPLWPLYRTFVGFGMLAAALVATAWQLTEPVIAANRLALLESRVRDVVPGVIEVRGYRWDESSEVGAPRSGRFAAATTPAEAQVWAGFDDRGGLIGVAFEASAMGYQDQVQVLVGYAPGSETLLGLRVLASRETPGLGDRVGNDPTFLGEWSGRSMPRADNGELAFSLELAGRDGGGEPWHVDGISGATISSRAVVAAVNRGASAWIPKLAASTADFSPTSEPGS